MADDKRMEVAGLAHELRNHFTVMQNALYLLRKRLTNGDGAAERPLQMLEAEVQAARALAEDVLEACRPVRANPRPGDIAAWVRGAAEGAALGAPEVRLRLPEEEVMGRADPVLLTRMVRNLVNNAVQAMGPRGGEIAISVTREGDHVVTRVEDAGPGLRPGEEEAVFEPFFTSGGTGLGLTLVRVFAEAQGGTVEAANRPQGGAVFTIRLPAGEAR